MKDNQKYQLKTKQTKPQLKAHKTYLVTKQKNGIKGDANIVSL